MEICLLCFVFFFLTPALSKGEGADVELICDRYYNNQEDYLYMEISRVRGCNGAHFMERSGIKIARVENPTRRGTPK